MNIDINSLSKQVNIRYKCANCTYVFDSQLRINCPRCNSNACDVMLVMQ